MCEEVTLRIAGQAGQGLKTTGKVLCRTFKRAGLNVFANMDYMSRIRGGNNFFQIRVAEKPVLTLREKCDVIVAMDADSVGIHRKALSDNGILLCDLEKNGLDEEKSCVDVPFFKKADEIGGSEKYTGAVMTGFLLGLIAPHGIDKAGEVMREILSDKGEETVGNNLDAVKAGYELAKESGREGSFAPKPSATGADVLMDGNRAIAIGAVSAGLRFYSAYPMTPATSIMTDLCEVARKFGILVEQAEDEIAAVNMAIGASFAGTRAMTGTSGGGFALMQEGISLAAMTETPLVVVDSQRPAPATGLPTRTEQGDLDMAIHSGHGEFAKAVFTPGTAEEAFYLTQKAFNLADKYQIPVIILTDQHLADSERNFKRPDTAEISIERGLLEREKSGDMEGYKRYAFTSSGISPRAVPSWIKEVVYADSDEHTEEGHITESARVREDMVVKRLYKKMGGLSEEIVPPVCHATEGADVILAGFGSTYGVIREFCERYEGKKAGQVHFPQVWPFPAEKFKKIAEKAEEIIVVENNALGQLARLIRRETGIDVDGSILKFDGRPFNVDLLISLIEGENNGR